MFSGFLRVQNHDLYLIAITPRLVLAYEQVSNQGERLSGRFATPNGFPTRNIDCLDAFLWSHDVGDTAIRVNHYSWRELEGPFASDLLSGGRGYAAEHQCCCADN
jgi:hypothetical protein